MLNETSLDIATNIHHRHGFSLLVNKLSNFVKGYEFMECEGLLCEQSIYQKMSYLFAERFFSGNKSLSICGKQMVIYITKIDLTEIEMGAVDLSHPSLAQNNNDSGTAEYLIQQNNMALAYLKNPFSDAFQSSELTRELTELNESLSMMQESSHASLILDFLNQKIEHLQAVILFSHVLNLVCLSQSLYAFSYQLKVNRNFARIIELILKIAVISDIPGVEHVKKLAERFHQIIIGNLAARAFSGQTLEIVEKALAIGAEK